MADLEKADILSLDYDQKIKMLEQIAQEILNYRMEFAKISGRHAELRANIQVLLQVKSALQSAIKAEGQL